MLPLIMQIMLIPDQDQPFGQKRAFYTVCSAAGSGSAAFRGFLPLLGRLCTPVRHVAAQLCSPSDGEGAITFFYKKYGWIPRPKRC